MCVNDRRTLDDDIHDQRVAQEYKQVIDNPHSTNQLIKNYSLFIKKPSNSSSFEIGATYMGTRICQHNGEEYEESTVIYVEDRYTTKDGNDYITARMIYREILKIDKENNKAKYVVDIIDYLPSFIHSHPYLIERIDGVETVLFNGVYLFEECDDVAGARISSETEAELRGWWLVPDNILVP